MMSLMSALPQPQVEVLSEEEGEEEDEEEDILSLAEEKYRPAALEKMIALIALLVEQSRSERCEMMGPMSANAVDFILLLNEKHSPTSLSSADT